MELKGYFSLRVDLSLSPCRCYGDLTTSR